MIDEKKFLKRLVELGHLSEIDLFFAEFLAQEQKTEQCFSFFSALLWSSRQGNLCLKLDEENFSSFGVEGAQYFELVFRGAKAFKPSLQFSPIYNYKNAFYLQKNWFFETRFLEHFKRILSRPKVPVDYATHSELTKEQNLAVEKALTLPFSVICGGPGTGKSFTAARIVSSFLQKNPQARIALAAPTGKAAKHLAHIAEQNDKIRISTLHSLLGVHKKTDFSEDPSPLMEDLLIIDESSMIDARLFSYLLSAVHSPTQLVLLGDPYQLPPVDMGCLFVDLVDVMKEKFPQHLTLLTTHLRTENREILDLADSIKSGDFEKVLTTVSFELKEDADETIWEHVYPYFPKPTLHEIDPQDLMRSKNQFCLLSCLRKGPFGVDAMNRMIAERLMSQIKKEERLAIPILITKSDPNLNLYNGETGFLIKSLHKDDYAFFGTQKFKAAELPSYEYAYCLSVHKSQGSEYEHLVLLAPSGSENFGREVLYTGVTRAKKSLKLAADPNILRASMSRVSRKISSLHDRLKE
jgi:exodeoxyribonuclease V alpha subunit